MLSNLAVENFRSLEHAKLAFGPITVFFGPTAAGKSSVFYALLALRNFVLNPNQASDGFFNLGFQNLGGFDACVFNHLPNKAITISAGFGVGDDIGWYGARIGKSETEILSSVGGISMRAKVSTPYAANQSSSYPYESSGIEYAVNWNGIAATVAPKTPTSESQAEAKATAERLNEPVESLKRIDICPHRRGFFKPNYTSVAPGTTPTSEDEVASLIINDQHAPARISIDTNEIFGRDFRLHTPPGTAITFLQTTEVSGARVPALLVNDGFGVNQVVYMLAKIHRPEVETVLIEEPEVHLHPTVVRRFARVLARLAVEDHKQLIFTTHSEQFLLSLLACVKDQIIKPEQVICYHATRPRKTTEFARESVSRDGQIAGGLSSFMQAELEDIKTFLGVT